MRFNWLNLRNIRSYSNAKIEFPAGSVLLSGDIGSGKSTVLLAIEFALFGLLRGETTGAALLRHGAMKGEVELCAEIDGKEFIVKRTLSRKGTSVQQDKGYLIIDGKKTEGTSSEIKASIFSLIGYPVSMITKSKLLYRYTVYTPQEEMKRVIMDSSEDRLHMVRKLFDVDKYEQMKQNITLVSRLFREKRKLMEGQLADVDAKSKLLEQVREDVRLLEAQDEKIKPRVEAAKASVAACRKGVDASSGELERLRTIREELARQDVQRLSITKELERISKQLEGLPGKIEGEVDDALPGRLTAAKMSLMQSEDSIRSHAETMAQFRAQQAMLAERKAKVLGLAECPTCLQEVPPQHKERIVVDTDSELGKISLGLEDHSRILKKIEKQVAVLKSDIDVLNRKVQDQEVLKARIEASRKAEEMRTMLSMQQQELERSFSELTSPEHLAKARKDVVSAEAVLVKEREKLDAAMRQERDALLALTALEERRAAAVRQCGMLERELEKKKEVKKGVDRVKRFSSWLENSAVPLISLMEKNVLAKLHSEFESRFESWFDLLLGESDISVRIDEVFTPIVVQNGYDIPVGFLSGGEQTSCALAYRLALNAVVNEVVSVKTKDVIILDEPTDGFSEEQLARMRDVLDQMPCSQIILVSHDQMLESFVDSIIKIKKSESESRIVA